MLIGDKHYLVGEPRRDRVRHAKPTSLSPVVLSEQFRACVLQSLLSMEIAVGPVARALTLGRGVVRHG